MERPRFKDMVLLGPALTVVKTRDPGPLLQSTKTQLGALDKLATILIVSFGIMVTGEIAGYAFKSILALGGVSGKPCV